MKLYFTLDSFHLVSQCIQGHPIKVGESWMKPEYFFVTVPVGDKNVTASLSRPQLHRYLSSQGRGCKTAQCDVSVK